MGACRLQIKRWTTNPSTIGVLNWSFANLKGLRF
jgi:hypothetical protein